jgi:hypothetical protein
MNIVSPIYDFEKLTIQSKQLLVEAFIFWHEKNDKFHENDLSDHAQDMFEATDTEIFVIKLNSEVFGIFFYVLKGNIAEIGGGLIKEKKSIYRLAHIVFSFSTKYLIKKNVSFILLSVINNHYKYEALIRYYKSFGFKINQLNDCKTFLKLSLKERVVSSC